jgi:septum formation protein
MFEELDNMLNNPKLTNGLTPTDLVKLKQAIKAAKKVFNQNAKDRKPPMFAMTAEQCDLFMDTVMKDSALYETLKNWQSDPEMANYTHPGDGYVMCETCHKNHWGLNGASGLFVVRTAGGKVSEILLQQRALHIGNGGTWGAPSGAIADGLTPYDSALMEAKEESNINLENIDIVGKTIRDHGNWAFTSFLAIEKSDKPINLKIMDNESYSQRFVPIQQLKTYNLLPHLESEIPELIAAVEDSLSQNS